MATSDIFPGTRLNSALRIRVQGSVDSNVLKLINEWNYDESGGAVHTRIRQGGSTASIHDIGIGDILATLGPLFKRELGVHEDTYGETTFGKMPVIGSVTGLPSWGPGVTYIGPESEKRAAMADYLLRGIHFAGVADANYYGGGDRPTPLQQGLPVDILSVNSLYIPIRGEVQPMTPVKLAIDQGNVTSDKPSRLTLEHIKPTSIAAQMRRAALAYAKALRTKDGGDKLMFMNVHKETQLRGSVIMRDDVEIGHRFLLGQVGCFLHFFNLFQDIYGGADKVAQKTNMLKAVQLNFFSDVSDKAKLEQLSDFFTKFADVKPVQVPTDFLIDNITQNGLNHVTQAVAEMAISNNRGIGKIIREVPTATSDGVRKKVEAMLSV
jgi:hypothetical protein